MRVHHISDGEISQNIIQCLEQSGVRTIADLIAEKKLRKGNGGFLTHKQLLYEYFDDYAEASGSTLRYFLFGTDEPPEAYYTPYDAEVIKCLNSLTPAQLRGLKHASQMLFSNPLIEATDESLTPTQRLLSVVNLNRPKMLPTQIPPEDEKKFRYPVLQELERYRAYYRSKAFNFDANYLPDLATLFGVSIRWVLGSKKGIVYCNNQNAEDLFAFYTLLRPMDQIDFCGLLLIASGEDYPMLTWRVQKERRCI